MEGTGRRAIVSSRSIGYFEALCGVILTVICGILMMGAFVPLEEQRDLALFGFVGGILMLPIGLALILAGWTLWRHGWDRMRIQLLPAASGMLAVVAYWWVDHGSGLGLAGTVVAAAGFALCGLLAVWGLKH